LSRYEVRRGDRAYASAGVNWHSPRYAELYVYVDPSVRGRGWGKSVVASATGELLNAGLIPLYVVAEDNLASIRTAEAVGYVDTGLREYVCEAVRLGD
ncbi:MAG: GNAT family N-acetyltransferase, partial [Chloroflexi bacterium]|nr:GNAT family N-acetyltransferase [Chloroflexota bacterium]